MVAWSGVACVILTKSYFSKFVNSEAKSAIIYVSIVNQAGGYERSFKYK